MSHRSGMHWWLSSKKTNTNYNILWEMCLGMILTMTKWSHTMNWQISVWNSISERWQSRGYTERAPTPEEKTELWINKNSHSPSIMLSDIFKCVLLPRKLILSGVRSIWKNVDGLLTRFISCSFVIISEVCVVRVETTTVKMSTQMKAKKVKIKSGRRISVNWISSIDLFGGSLISLRHFSLNLTKTKISSLSQNRSKPFFAQYSVLQIMK